MVNPSPLILIKSFLHKWVIAFLLPLILVSNLQASNTVINNDEGSETRVSSLRLPAARVVVPAMIATSLMTELVAASSTGSAAVSPTNCPTASSTNYSQTILISLATAIGGGIVGPTIKTRVIDPAWNWVSDRFTIPSYCRRSSREDMDIRDLFRPQPAKTYKRLLQNLDESLTNADWKKYPLVSEGRLVGYQYQLLRDGVERATIAIAREYHGLPNKNRLYPLHRDLSGKSLEVKQIEADNEEAISATTNKKDYYLYNKDEVKIVAREIPIHYLIIDQENPQVYMGLEENEGEEEAPNNMSPLGRFESFQTALLSDIPQLNIRHRLKETLALYLEEGMNLWISSNNEYARLSMNPPSSLGFNIYVNKRT